MITTAPNSQFTIHNSQFRPGILLSIAIAAFIFVGCESSETQERPERPENVEILPEVIFSTVDGEALDFHLDTRGIVEPVREFSVVPRVGGFVKSHRIEDGNRVRQGDVLLEFVDDEWRIGLEEAQNRYLRARQDFDMELRLRNSSPRRSTMQSASPNGNGEGETRAAATDTLSLFDERLLMNQTGYAEARTALERAELEKTYTSIRAPFDGHIHTTDIFAEGGFVSGGSEMAKLLDYSRIRVRFDVLESEMLEVEPGMSVRIRAADGTELQGRVRSISPQVDRDRKTGQVIAEADNPGGRLKPGMSVDGRIFIGSAEGRVRVPRAALLERDNRPLIFKLNNDQIEWIYVTPVAMTSDWVILNEPNISPGDTLAVDRHFAVSHLQRVRPTMR